MKKLRKQAGELLIAASKVYNYRRDVLHTGRLEQLEKAVAEVEALQKDPAAERAPLEAAMERLDALLRKIGGKIYPKTFWSDNMEVALVAAIIVIGIRTFFFQPFIIPTNSMYPTYSGMNSVLYASDEDLPSAGMKVLRKLTLGADHFNLPAAGSGEVMVPIFSQAANSPDAELRRSGGVRFKVVKARKWFGLLPATKKEYTLYVDGRPTSVRVPLDFSLDDVIAEAFFPEAENFKEVLQTEYFAGRLNIESPNPMLATGVNVAAGESALAFDITLGDALFVDRLTYHFKRPQAGDPFVFRTRDIPGVEGGINSYVDKYYIKRIGGVGGETLEIKNNTLFANGQPRDEVQAYGRNARLEGEYSGYINAGLLDEGRQLSIPEGKFVSLGDNSGNSLDSRYWGFVPDTSVIGKAIFIYYPFTKRWGLAE